MCPKIPALALTLSAFSLGACADERVRDDGEDGPVDRAGEPCEVHMDSAPCGEDDEGIQYCAWNLWGECLSVDEQACDLGDSKFAYTSYYCGDMFSECVLDESGAPSWFTPTCDTPLVLDFGDGIEMIPVTDERFNINALENSCQETDWPAAQTPWLALDRDQNGSIDDGTELFGSGTRLADGRRAQHGFEALAELDQNGDGKISMLDAAYSRLVLWSDYDHDRRSTGSELTTLADAGVSELDLGYVDLLSCDERGNCGKQRATFSDASGGVAGQVVDVHLPCR